MPPSLGDKTLAICKNRKRGYMRTSTCLLRESSPINELLHCKYIPQLLTVGVEDTGAQERMHLLPEKVAWGMLSVTRSSLRLQPAHLFHSFGSPWRGQSHSAGLHCS